jgi:hypothetical protein
MSAEQTTNHPQNFSASTFYITLFFFISEIALQVAPKIDSHGLCCPFSVHSIGFQ